MKLSKRGISVVGFTVIIIGVILLDIVIVKELKKDPPYNKDVEDCTEGLSTKREELTENIDKVYLIKLFPVNIEILTMCKDIDYLVLEYDILYTTIFNTYDLEEIKPISGTIDQSLMVVDANLGDLESMIKNTNKIYLEKRIARINSMIQYFNSDPTGMQENLNLWWYALGSDREKYEYIIDNINKETTEINASIKSYNDIWKTHIPTIYDLEPLYPYNDKFDESYLSEIYERIKEHPSVFE